MKVAFGIKAHSGWAALVAIGAHPDVNDGRFIIADRRRIELVDEAWAKQPYHAAEKLEAGVARETVERGVAAAKRVAVRELRAALSRERERGNDAVACAVLVANAMPAWSVAEILAVHIRMHKAEGVLFRDALLDAAKACGLAQLPIPEKELMERAVNSLGKPASFILAMLAALGKSAGPPWGKDQKDAALAAMIALSGQLK
jgi:hypothetical protein